jgi:menaquinone-dependent protoporphyrinogen oxidase
MKILILYATTEGQTRKVARRVFDHLGAAGHAAELIAAGDADDLTPATFDAVILAASVHAGRYQKPLVDWATAQAQSLARAPTLFLSVSLSAAGDDADDWEGLRNCVRAFESETGWTPERVEHVAGAFKFREYDFFRYWAMRWIAASKDETVHPGHDREYTDWARLTRALDDWLAQIALPGAPPGAARTEPPIRNRAS